MATDAELEIKCVFNPEEFEKDYKDFSKKLEKTNEQLDKNAVVKMKLKIDKANLTKQADEIEKKYRQLESKLSTQRTQLKTIKQEKVSAEGQGFKNIQIEAKKKEISETKAQMKELQRETEIVDQKWAIVEKKMQSAKNKTAELKEEQKQYNATLDSMDRALEAVSGEKAQYYGKQIGMENLKDSIKGGVKEIADQTEGLKTKMDGVITKARNWLLAIFSIRGAYSIITRAISTVTQYNEDLANKIESIKYSLSMALAPVIETIVNWVYTIVQYIQYIVKALTGYDIFQSATEASAKAMASAAGSAKTIHKELAGFDEMNVMSDNSTGGGGAGGGGIPEAMKGLDEVEIPEWLKKLVDFLKPIWQWISSIAEALGPVQTFLLLWGGGKLLKLITGLIGTSGGKTGLLGLVGAIDLLIASLGIVKPLVEDMPAVADRLKGSGATFQGPVGAGFQAIGENFDKFLTGIFMPDAKPGERFSTELQVKEVQKLRKMMGQESPWEDTWLETTNINLVNDYKDTVFKLNQEYEKQIDNLDKTKATIQPYMTQLEGMIDSNGKVKEGYEGIAKVLLEDIAKATGQNIELDGNQIKVNGEVVDSFNALTSSVDKSVQSLKDKLEQEKLNSEYTETIKTEIEVRNKLEEADKNLVEAQKSGDEERIKSAERTKNAIQNEYDSLQRKESEIQQEMVENQIRSTDTLSKGLVEQYDLSSDTLDDIFNNNKKNWEDTYSQLDADRKAYMLDATKALHNHKDEYVGKWKDLADESESAFAKGLVNMSTAEQTELTNMLKGTGTKAEKIANQLGGIPDNGRQYLQQHWGELDKKFNGNLQMMIDDATDKGDEIADSLSSPLSTMSESEKAQQWGNHFLSNWLSGFKNKWDWGGLSLVRGVARQIANQFEHSIPDPSSPFAGDQYWGEHFIDNITNGIKKASPELIKTAQGLADQVAEITQDGLINYPSSGTLIYGAGDFNTASSIGKEIGKNISLTATIVNKMNSRVISRELVQTQTEQDFAYNS